MGVLNNEILNLPATILPYGIGYLMDTVFISTLILLRLE